MTVGAALRSGARAFRFAWRARFFYRLFLGGEQQAVEHWREMRAHGGARGRGIAGAQGAEHGRVFVDHRLDIGGARLFMQQRRLGRSVAHVPQVLDRFQHRAVAGGAGDGEVEGAVGLFGARGIVVFPLAIASTSRRSRQSRRR